jgi:hypothetical protein
LKQIRKRLTYANVMSSIAVFAVLGGAAVAAVELPKNSVGTKQLKKNAVKASKIGKSAVKASKIAKGAVQTDHIADGAVTTPKIANDAVTGEKVNESTLAAVPDASKLGGKLPAAYESKAVEVGTNANVDISGTKTTTVQSLSLPAGTYVLIGRGTVNNNGGAAFDGGDLTCSVNAGADLREVRSFTLGATGTPGEREDFSAQLLHTFAAPGTATLTCTTTAAFTGNVITPALTAISIQP